MKYLEKLNSLNYLVDKIKNKIDLDSTKASVYVNSEYFKDCYELGVDSLGVYIVTNNIDEKNAYSLELELNSISMDYSFNIIDEDTFANNFKEESTKIF